MILYTTQALFLGTLLWCVTLSSRRTDSFINVYVCVWTIGVIVLYWRYGIAQNLFYSNDQRIQVQMVQLIATNGVEHSLNGIISYRYVITIPAYLLTRCGIDSLLALKFLQAVFFVLTYRLVRDRFAITNLKFKTWYLLLFSGPIFIFMSVLGLRDLALAYFSLNTIIGQHREIRTASWICAFLLRPHLAIALAFGRLITIGYRRTPLNHRLLLLPIITLFSFVSGSYGYVIGSHFQSGTDTNFDVVSRLWSQTNFARLFANFGGLQFLLLGPDVVEFSIMRLLLLRIIFIDTFLIPLLFIWIIIMGSKLQIRSVGIFSSFAFFLGLISHTEFNSSRQNIPFLVLMGVTVAEHYARRGQSDRNRHMNNEAVSVGSSQLLGHA